LYKTYYPCNIRHLKRRFLDAISGQSPDLPRFGHLFRKVRISLFFEALTIENWVNWPSFEPKIGAGRAIGRFAQPPQLRAGCPMCREIPRDPARIAALVPAHATRAPAAATTRDTHTIP
jgi:hypothetical protein